MPRTLFYDLIEKIYGVEARKVLEVLMREGKELTEIDIAEKTGLKISAIRRSLNALAENSLVVYRKVQLPEKSRPIFLWKASEAGVKSLVQIRKKAVLDKLKTILEHEESNYYYVCPFDGTRYTFDEALEYNFMCPRCGSMLEPDGHREERIKFLKEVIKRLEKSIS